MVDFFVRQLRPELHNSAGVPGRHGPTRLRCKKGPPEKCEAATVARILRTDFIGTINNSIIIIIDGMNKYKLL